MKAFANPHNTQEHGMDLRDWFAGLALQGIISNEGDTPEFIHLNAKIAYEMADAMLQARKSNEENTGR